MNVTEFTSRRKPGSWSFLWIILIVFFTPVIHAQEYNSYLVKREKWKSDYLKQYKGQLFYRTNGDIVGQYIYSLGPLDMCKLDDNYRNPKIIDEAKAVQVNIREIDYAKAGIDTTGLGYAIFIKMEKEISNGYMTPEGKFILQPLFTHVTILDKAVHSFRGPIHLLFGQRLKSGNWKLYILSHPDFVPLYMGESADFHALTMNQIAYQANDGKWGLMDMRGTMLTWPTYDSISFLRLLSGKFEYNNLSFEEEYSSKRLRTFLTEIRDESIPELLALHFGDSTCIVSGSGISTSFSHPKITQHSLQGGNAFFERNNEYIFITDKSGKYDLLGIRGSKIEPRYKYAYLEQVRMDSIKGSGWLKMIWGVDYSKPFGKIDIDSIRNARLNAEIERKRVIENAPDNYTGLLKGSYNITKFSEGGRQIRPNFTLLLIGTHDYNLINTTISVREGNYNPQSVLMDYSFSINDLILKTEKNGSMITIKSPDIQSHMIQGNYDPATGILKLEGRIATSKGVPSSFQLEAKKKP